MVVKCDTDHLVKGKQVLKEKQVAPPVLVTECGVLGDKQPPHGPGAQPWHYEGAEHYEGSQTGCQPRQIPSLNFQC